ncbi:hypothetical protein BH10CHL1_BH10CHL1_24320 [soil metagenome]
MNQSNRMITIRDKAGERRIPLDGDILAPASKAAQAIEPMPQVIEPIHHPPSQYVSHVRQDDDAITHAQASLLVSSSYMKTAGVITAGLMLTIWWWRGGDLGPYFFAGLVVWGISVLLALYINRGQGLRYSGAGIALGEQEVRKFEIASRERIATHAIDAHVALMKYNGGQDREY